MVISICMKEAVLLLTFNMSLWINSVPCCQCHIIHCRDWQFNFDKIIVSGSTIWSQYLVWSYDVNTENAHVPEVAQGSQYVKPPCAKQY